MLVEQYTLKNYTLIFLDYPEYPQYPPANYDSSKVKYEDEDEQKFDPENTNGSRQYDEEFEEGEAY